MFGFPTPYLIIGAIAASLAMTGAGYIKGRADGRAAILSQLQDDRIKVLHDGTVIDDKVLNADDQELCRLLSGDCG